MLGICLISQKSLNWRVKEGFNMSAHWQPVRVVLVEMYTPSHLLLMPVRKT